MRLSHDLNNLAISLHGQPLCRRQTTYTRCLAIDEKMRGLTIRLSPPTSTTLQRYTTRSLSAVEPLHMRSLAIQQKALGQTPDVAQSLHNLATLCASPLCRGANAFARMHRRESAGTDHQISPHPQRPRRLYQARPLSGRAVSSALLRYARMLGQAINLRHHAEQPAVVYCTRRTASRRRYQARACQIRKRWDDDPSIIPSSIIWRGCTTEGRFPRPNRLQRSLAIREKALGSDHPDVHNPQQYCIDVPSVGRDTEAEALPARTSPSKKALGLTIRMSRTLDNRVAARRAGRYAEASHSPALHLNPREGVGARPSHCCPIPQQSRDDV